MKSLSQDYLSSGQVGHGVFSPPCLIHMVRIFFFFFFFFFSVTEYFIILISNKNDFDCSYLETLRSFFFFFFFFFFFSISGGHNTYMVRSILFCNGIFYSLDKTSNKKALDCNCSSNAQ